jgi:CRP-like cAMP-binding protein
MGGILSDDRLAAFQADPGTTLAPVGGGLVALPAGTCFLRQGGAVNHLYCVVSGTIKVEASDWDDKTLKGRLGELPWLVGLVAHGLASKLGDRARESARSQLCPLAVRYESYLEEMGAGGRPVPIDLAQTASLLAVSPRHLQRVIRDLVDQGMVVRRGRSLVVSRWA